MSTSPRAWLVKSEPTDFSFDDLLAAKEKRTGWSGVRNAQARNHMRDDMHVGDPVLFYHSSADPTGVVGLARVASKPDSDPTQFDARSPYHDPTSDRAAPRWVQVDLEAVERFPEVLTLARMKAAPELATMLVLRRGQRLSVMPVTEAELTAVLRLARGGVGRASAAPAASKRAPAPRTRARKAR